MITYNNSRVNLIIILISTIISSCGTAQIYQTPEFIKSLHAEEMAKFKSKREIIIEFGAPDKTAAIDSIEVLEYQMGEFTNSTSVGMATGQNIQTRNITGMVYSGIMMLAGNPYFNPTIMNSPNNVIMSQFVTSNIMNTSSDTKLKYAKFWLLNGKVIKWETSGIDLSKPLPNPEFSIEKKNAFEAARKKQAKISTIFLLSSITAFIVLLLTVPV